MSIKTKIGVDANGMDRFQYDLSDHPGMQCPDVTKHTHLIVMTGPLAGSVSVPDGTSYDITDTYIAVPIEHVDDVSAKIHEVALAAGLTDQPVPAVGPLLAARAEFVAAGWTPQPAEN